VREAAALALRPERAPGAPKDIWHDDVQALADGGRDLSPEAHRLLAISTLLINLAERAFGENGGEARRDKALTADVLPYCFSRGMYTRTLNQFACARGCGFELCQSKVLGKIGQRDQPRQRAFSRSFVARARRTSTAPLAGGRGSFGGRAFRRIWRDLDRELARSG